MKKIFCRLYGKLAVLFMVGAILTLSGCAGPQAEGFAVYLTRDDVPPARMPVLSYVDLAEQPVFAASDIITYAAKTHEITLTADAYERILKLEVPVSGKSFVVCVNKSPVYWGAFFTPLSSLSFDGVVIMKPLGSQDAKVIRLELGYPSASFYKGEDPRSSAEVMQSLEQAGKLK